MISNSFIWRHSKKWNNLNNTMKFTKNSLNSLNSLNRFLLNRKSFMKSYSIASLDSQIISSKTKLPYNEFSLYFHYPYCNKMCGYCNFNKFLKHRKDNPSDMELLEAYIHSLELIKESNYYNQWRNIGRPLQLRSVFFGGGTPSLGDPVMYKKLIAYIKDTFPTIVDHDSDNSPLDLEISLEMNPTLATPDTLYDLHDAGVNRISIGIQSLKDEDLKFLGREHSSKQAIHILQQAISLYKNKVSADLMFGLPSHHRDVNNFTNDSLIPLLEMGLNHISLYELTIEKGTLFHKLYRLDEIEKQDEDILATLYESCIDICKKYGLYQYEVSNFCSTLNDECKHNISYWQGIDYIGIGPGAHSRITDIEANIRYELAQFAKPEDWKFECLTPIESKKNHLIQWGGNSKIEMINLQQRIQEIIMVALRMPRVGLSLSQFRYHNGDKKSTFFDGKFLNTQKLKLMINNGLLRIIKINDEEVLQATETGIRVLNGIINEIMN